MEGVEVVREGVESAKSVCAGGGRRGCRRGGGRGGFKYWMAGRKNLNV